MISSCCNAFEIPSQTILDRQPVAAFCPYISPAAIDAPLELAAFVQQSDFFIPPKLIVETGGVPAGVVHTFFSRASRETRVIGHPSGRHAARRRPRSPPLCKPA
jgi:hypothetical protein